MDFATHASPGHFVRSGNRIAHILRDANKGLDQAQCGGRATPLREACFKGTTHSHMPLLPGTRRCALRSAAHP
jgi:hypothetical protein